MVNLTYYDETQQRMRLKRRYVWACWGYAAGFASALLLGLMLF